MLVSFQTLARGITLAPRSNIELNPPTAFFSTLKYTLVIAGKKGHKKNKPIFSLISASAQKWFSNLGVGSK